MKIDSTMKFRLFPEELGVHARGSFSDCLLASLMECKVLCFWIAADASESYVKI